MTLDDLESLAAALPEIEAWDPLQILDSVSVRHGDAATLARVIGQSERAERIWERSTTRGEFFDAAAVNRSARVALIGATIERDLFAGEDPIGAEIQIGGTPFRVIGTLEPMGTDVHGIDRDGEIAVPISTVMHRLMNTDTLRGAKLVVKNPSSISETASEMTRLLRERHSLSPGQPDDFTVVTPVAVKEMVGRIQRILFLFLPMVAAIALLAGAIVAACLMLLSVTERKSEIGLRRAVGALPRDIALQFLLETGVTTFSGGLMGLLVGGLVSLLVAQRLGLNAFFSWKAALIGLALSLLVGLAAGVIPARRAAMMQPVDALR
jgi:putative ABC transport system permease protein